MTLEEIIKDAVDNGTYDTYLTAPDVFDVCVPDALIDEFCVDNNGMIRLVDEDAYLKKITRMMRKEIKARGDSAPPSRAAERTRRFIARLQKSR